MDEDAPVVSSPWVAFGIGAAVASLGMAVLWALQVRIRDATHVDVAWAYLIGIVGVLDALLGDGRAEHRLLIGALTAVWSLRLGTYLLVNRIVRSDTEDGRYKELRARWGAHANRRFFVFFQAQALFVLIFTVPALLTSFNPRGFSGLELAGAALVGIGLSGGSVADLQLSRWRANPANRGVTARTGLWNYSRHPNYFFETVDWIGFALIASAAPWGWLAFLTPAILLLLLFTVTGIPPTEEQALRTRGEDYRRYQEEVSVFVPWLPKRRSR